MKKKQILLNALTTFAQVVGSAGALFFLYRLLIRECGIERLGIWSLVLATTSVAMLASQGLSTSIVKHVAKYAARENAEDVSTLIQTALISMGLALAVVCVGLYPAAQWFLRFILPRPSFAEASAILPFALVSLWINVVAGILQAGLAGHELITLCNYVELSGVWSYLFLAWVLIRRFGLLGLAYSQTVVAVAVLLVSWILLRRRIPQLPFIPRRWDGKLFCEMAAYGFQFQFITASQAIREPVTKALLVKFGGLAMTGIYDLASRWVVTFRELIVQANQVLVPTISSLHEREPESIPVVYRESYRLIFFLAIPTFTFLIVASPIVSLLWIGHYERIFVYFVALLAAGWLVNVLCNPSYVVRLGTGELRWVATGCGATAILNAVLGAIAGRYWGGTAVVAASMFSLVAGYLIVTGSYHIENRVPFGQLLPKESAGIVLTSLAGPLVILPHLWPLPVYSLLTAHMTAGAVAGIIAMMGIAMWIHPMRKRLYRWVFSRSLA
jgi:O-antigen/teichoic acid export membrane protein